MSINIIAKTVLYVLQVVATYTPGPCFPETKFMIAVLNGSQVEKVYSSPGWLGLYCSILEGGKAGTGNITFTLNDEPLEHGKLYRTPFTFACNSARMTIFWGGTDYLHIQ